MNTWFVGIVVLFSFWSGECGAWCWSFTGNKTGPEKMCLLGSG